MATEWLHVCVQWASIIMNADIHQSTATAQVLYQQSSTVADSTTSHLVQLISSAETKKN